MLWACLYLPQVPLEIYQQHDTAKALVIEETLHNRRLVTYANTEACAAGILIGTTIPTALSLANDLVVKERNNEREQETLASLATLGHQFTPQVSIKPPFSILLELSGSIRLFGGEPALQIALEKAFTKTTHKVHLAFCETPLSSQLLARYKAENSSETRAFFSMPDANHCGIHLLDISDKQLAQLDGMGFSSLGELLQLPKDSLAKRFGENFVMYLDRITGSRNDPQPAFKLPPHFNQRIDFVEELIHTDALLFPINRLTSTLEDYLLARQLCAKSFILTLHERFKHSQSLVIQLAQPHCEAAHFIKLIRHQLSKVTLNQPVVGLQLKARHFAPLAQQSTDLFADKHRSDNDRFALIDSLKARLGHQNVWGLSLTQDHRPEKSWQVSMPGKGTTFTHPANQRPIWLLRSPQKLTIKKGLPVYGEILSLLKGPERIETGWWDLSRVNRDYYVAQHPNGTGYWVYKDRNQQEQWFLHGVFG